MEVLILLVFVSLVLAASAVGFFAWNLARGNHHHADRLALLPLEDDGPHGGTERVSAPRAREAEDRPSRLQETNGAR